MEYEFNFDEMSKEQLQKKYKWNIQEIAYIRNKKKHQNLFDQICFYIDLLLGILLEFVGFYFIFEENPSIAGILGFIFMFFHVQCCGGFIEYSEKSIEELENRILELENENAIISKKILMNN